jgi:hypothetical protein
MAKPSILINNGNTLRIMIPRNLATCTQKQADIRHANAGCPRQLKPDIAIAFQERPVKKEIIVV